MEAICQDLLSKPSEVQQKAIEYIIETKAELSSAKCLLPLARLSMSSRDDTVRSSALKAVEAIGLDNIVDPTSLLEAIVEVLDNGTPEQRVYAFMLAERLGRQARPILPMLLRMAREGSPWQSAALMSVGAVGTPEDAGWEVLEIYRAGTEDGARPYAAIAMGRLQMLEAAAELARDLSSASPLMRKSAFEGLAHLRFIDDATAEALAQAIVRERSDREVQFLALNALRRAVTVSRGMAKAVLAGLEADEPQVREAAMNLAAATHMTDPEVVQAMLEATTSRTLASFERIRAQNALTAIAGGAVPQFKRLVQQAQHEERVSAAKALGATSSRGVAALVELSSSGDIWIKQAAVRGMRESSAYQSMLVEPLSRCIRDEETSYDAIQTVRAIGLCDEPIVTALTEVAGDQHSSPSVRALAAEVLRECQAKVRGSCGSAAPTTRPGTPALHRQVGRWR